MLEHEEDNMENVGCDIGKNNLDIFFRGKHRRYENSAKGIEEFIVTYCKSEGIRVILEPSGGYERRLLRRLFENKVKVSVVNPYYVRNFARSGKDLAKTDKIDSKMLAEYGDKMDPKVQERKEEYRFELEELTNRRDALIESTKEEKLRLEKEPSQIIVDSIQKHLEFLKEQIQFIEKQIEFIVEQHAKPVQEVLCSEKGIGAQTAAILLASLPELGQANNREIAKLVGLAPMAKESGRMKAGRHIRGGRARVRRVLFMASISAIRSNSKVSDFYNRLKSQGKPSFVALTAVARKLLVILNAKMRAFLAGKDFF